LFELGAIAQKLCRSADVEPVAYGSLAYIAHTGDWTSGLNDIDFLVPETAFAAIAEATQGVPALRIETTTYHSLKLFRGTDKVSFDSIVDYLAGIGWQAQAVTVAGLSVSVVDPQALAECYRRAAAAIPQKREAYGRKFARLQRKSG
jgi:hypothetical protein